MIPDYQSCVRPALAHLADGQLHRSREVRDALADRFGLSEAERAELLPSGRKRVIDNRVGWALTYLSQAGLVDRPSRGHVHISESGQIVLARNPDRVDLKMLEQFRSYLERRDRTPEAKAGSSDPSVEHAAAEVLPEDLLATAVAEKKRALEGEMLKRALALHPRGFELVLRLLAAMGYGKVGAVEHSGQSGDGGIDGMINQDPLGLDRIYLQAKQYATERTVGRPTSQAFAGALMSAQGGRGVFLTTASFTQEAIEEARRVNLRIELIDGKRLADLMLRHGVGVQPKANVTLYDLDEDFFEEL